VTCYRCHAPSSGSHTDGGGVSRPRRLSQAQGAIPQAIAHALTPPHLTLAMMGTQILHYRIEAKLGEGGMSHRPLN
jgi:hypothetical protein